MKTFPPPGRRHARLPTLLLLLLVSAWTCQPLSCHARLGVDHLRVESLDNPLSLDTPTPRLSWILTSRERAQYQSAFQILVATREDLLVPGQADLWDTGKILSPESLHIRYAGKPLASRQPCFWKVRVWDREDKPSAWSDTRRWEMGLLNRTDWTARWIGRTASTEPEPAPMLRRAFEVRGHPVRARLYACGLGYADLSLNGKAVANALLDPAFTRYDRRVLYTTHDVTRLIRPGRNTVGAILGTGWFNTHVRAVWNFHQAPWRMSPRLLLQLHLDYPDGHSEVIATDRTWETATGPILFDSIYGGETYDARLERPGWNDPTPNAADAPADWSPALELPAPAGTLRAQTLPPIRSERTLPPSRITEPAPGIHVVDFGQNLAGFVELMVSGPAGTRVRLRYGERLGPDGRLDTHDIDQHIRSQGTNQSFQTDTYVLRGSGTERWHARFTYHGFQYVEVTGIRPGPDTLRAHFIHTAVAPAGTFECSNPDLNRIQAAARWSYLSNLQGIPTDCPHREKNGWTGDAHLAAEMANFNFDPLTAQAKWIDDLGDEQQPSGELPGIVPTSGWGYAWGNGPAWDSAFLLIPQYAHTYFADTSMFERHYEGMRRYVDHLTRLSHDGIVEAGLNDWAPWKTQTGAAITSTAYYFVDARIVAHAARLLGFHADAVKYDALAESIRRAFNRRFFHPDTGLYDEGSQTALACALHQGLVEPADRERVLNALVAAIDRTDGHLDTGILGAKYVLNALLDHGRPDVAARILTRTDAPGWIHWLRQGATTLWEQWNGTESRNHIMFGDVSAWFYKALAGIRPDPAAPGFKRFTLRPELVADLTWAKADYDSVRGRIDTRWERRENRFRLELTVPANTTATVHLPARADAPILEEGRPISQARGVRLLRQDGGRAILEVGSGSYDFASELPSPAH
jgi:alpha-L-rhamnosidase